MARAGEDGFRPRGAAAASPGVLRGGARTKHLTPAWALRALRRGHTEARSPGHGEAVPPQDRALGDLGGETKP